MTDEVRLAHRRESRRLFREAGILVAPEEVGAGRADERAARGRPTSANGLEKKLRPRRRNGSSLPHRRRRRKPLRHASRRGRG